MKSGFKGGVNWNEYQFKITTQIENLCLDYLIDLNFQGENGLFILSFKDKAVGTAHTGYFLLKVEMKDYNVMDDGTNFLVN